MPGSWPATACIPMLSLLDLQREFRAALLGGGAESALRHIADDGMHPSERLDVYRTNVMASLTAALAASFPVVCRLVDERFFAYVAGEFIRSRPPAAPCLAEYGAEFPRFLAAFPPCRDLVYLRDVAHLEWAMHRAANAPEAARLTALALRGISAEAAPRLTFRMAPSYAYVASPWPIDRIWRENRTRAAEEVIDLAEGGIQAEIRRACGVVEMHRLPPSVFAFRQALARGRRLAGAIEAALAEDEGFAVAPALAELIDEGAFSGFAIAEGEQE